MLYDLQSNITTLRNQYQTRLLTLMILRGFMSYNAVKKHCCTQQQKQKYKYTAKYWC